MLKLNELRPNKGARKKIKRVGRGHASGSGQQAGRGHKGQQSRSGGGVPYQGFEGGQKPLYKRIPKLKGFTYHAKREIGIINVADLAKFKTGSIVNLKTLQDAGIIHKKCDLLKILGDGELKIALTIQAHKFSDTAKTKIEKAGGKAEQVAILQPARKEKA